MNKNAVIAIVVIVVIILLGWWYMSAQTEAPVEGENMEETEQAANVSGSIDLELGEEGDAMEEEATQ